MSCPDGAISLAMWVVSTSMSGGDISVENTGYKIE